MKGIVVLSALLVAASAQSCFKDIEGCCDKLADATDVNCNPTYGSFESLKTRLQSYANAHIETSFEYLLMSSHFGNYEANREGFKALYRKLSDKAWNNAIDIIKFIAKRGGKMDLKKKPVFRNITEKQKFALTEISSLAQALDTEKQLANEALSIHSESHHFSKFDGSVGHYLEEKFIEDQAECVRTLAGHTTDVKKFLEHRDAAVAIFIFDEYLKKTL